MTCYALAIGVSFSAAQIGTPVRKIISVLVHASEPFLRRFIFDPDKEKVIIESRYVGLPHESIEYAFQQHFLDCIELAIKSKRDFVIETNFRDHALLDIAEQFKASGYTASMVYLVLDGVPQSIDRVLYRVNNGGHHVDDESVKYNYTEGLINLDYFADRFDNLEIIDASGNYFELRSVLSIRQQQLVYLSDDLSAGTNFLRRSIYPLHLAPL